MKRLFLHTVFITIVVWMMLPLPCSGNTYLETLRDATSILPNEELRAAWVVRYALTSKTEIDRAIDYAVRARFQLLFLQVRGRGDAYFRSSLEPEASDLTSPADRFDPLEYFLTRAHDEGIAVHAWINVCYVWSDPDRQPPSDHIVIRHPDWLMADAAGTRMDELSVDEWKRRGLEGYYVSPGNTAVRQHTVGVIEDIANRYPIDGVHLDYVRYPGLGFDFSENQRAAFELEYGVDPIDLQKKPEKWASLLGDDVFEVVDSLRIEWRIEQLDTLVRMVKASIGDLPLSAAVVPDYKRARDEKGQDWLEWVVRGDVDFVVPMAYTYQPADLSKLVARISRAIGTERFLVGLPVYEGRSRYLGYSVSLLRQQNILGYSLFSYNALVEEQFTLEFLEKVFLERYREPDEITEEEIKQMSGEQ